MIEKTEEMNALLDAYEMLLTDKQREIMSLYYKEDFSLSEIAEELSVCLLYTSPSPRDS